MMVSREEPRPSVDDSVSSLPSCAVPAGRSDAIRPRRGGVSPARIKVCLSEVTLTVLYLKALIALPYHSEHSRRCWFVPGSSARM